MLEKNRGNNTNLSTAGIGYVIIPNSCEAGEYISRCYRHKTISIGGIGTTDIHNVKVADYVFNKLKFPQSEGERGSAVVWVREGYYNKPVVVATLSGEGNSNLLSPYQDIFTQETSTQVVTLLLDALQSSVNLFALGNANKAAEIVIKASSTSTQGDVIKVDSKDKIIINGQQLKIDLSKGLEILIDNGKTKILQLIIDEKKLCIQDQWKNEFIVDEQGSKIKDKFENKFDVSQDEIHLTDNFGNEIITNEDNVQVKSKQINLGEGKEPMVLGDTLVDLLSQTIDAITTLTVPTSSGASGTPINTPQFTAIKSKLKTMLSKLSNTD